MASNQILGRRDQYPNGDCFWWMWSCDGSISRIHRDPDGAATAVVICDIAKDPTGKCWFLGEPIGNEGNLNFTCGTPSRYDTTGSNVDYYKYSGVRIVKNDML